MDFRGNVSFCFGGDLATKLGKKGTVSDITLYNTKVGDAVLSFVEPTGFPEKIQPLATAAAISDRAIINVDKITPELAEVIVALDMIGITKGYIICDEEKLPLFNQLIAGTVLEGYERLEDQIAMIREKIASDTPHTDGPPIVQIDASFQVKGVGTVALGVVKSGTLKKYDELDIAGEDKKAYIKSMQVHDVDVKTAVTGLRVGLALKDTTPEDVQRGTILSQDKSVGKTTDISGEVRISKFCKRSFAEGDEMMLSNCQNYSPARIKSGKMTPGESSHIVFELEKPITKYGGHLEILNPGGAKPRIFGTVKI